MTISPVACVTSGVPIGPARRWAAASYRPLRSLVRPVRHPYAV